MSVSAVEDIRLVIWDLDDTFWHGTLTEGGIQYNTVHHEIVIALAKRGIMSSICSKNNHDAVVSLLDQHKILDYFVFSSISWEPKGPRIKGIIDDFQLRPSTVMFIDDNPNNLADARNHVPGLITSDQHIITSILSDPRFRGKEDSNLKRLSQYKLLERRKSDNVVAAHSGVDNSDFLKMCDIRVFLDYDIRSNIDRAVELINRTNQLNFTKNRLPEDSDKARQILMDLCNDHFAQAGLVRVIDNYGDYGYVGFYLMLPSGVRSTDGTIKNRLVHYCFSCRTLGMKVEKWLYDYLGRPDLHINGEVLTDLESREVITWVRQIFSLSDSATKFEKVATEIRIHGGCEANAIAHYLTSRCDKIAVTGNFHAGTSFYRVNSVSILLSMCNRATPDFAYECEILGAPFAALTSTFISEVSAAPLFILEAQLDNPGSRHLVHKTRGWRLFVEPHGLAGIDPANIDVAQVLSITQAKGYSRDATESVLRQALHIKEHYNVTICKEESDFVQPARELLSAVPIGARVIFITNHDKVRLEDGRLIEAPWQINYDKLIRGLTEGLPYVGVVSFRDCVMHDDEIHIGGNHYDRMVYYRISQLICDIANKLSFKVL